MVGSNAERHCKASIEDADMGYNVCGPHVWHFGSVAAGVRGAIHCQYFTEKANFDLKPSLWFASDGGAVELRARFFNSVKHEPVYVDPICGDECWSKWALALLGVAAQNTVGNISAWYTRFHNWKCRGSWGSVESGNIVFEEDTEPLHYSQALGMYCFEWRFGEKLFRKKQIPDSC